MAQARVLPRNIHSHEHGAGKQPPDMVLFPAYTILPLLRWPIGYDIVRPMQAAKGFLVVSFLPYVFWFFYSGLTGRNPPPAWGGQSLLVALMAASFVASCITFAKRMHDQRGAKDINTAEAGYSFLTHQTQLPIPLSEIVLMPVLIGGAGWLIYSPATYDLSIYLMLCGVSYFCMAFWEHSRKWSQVRAMTNDMTRAQVFEERLGSHEAKARGYAKAAGASAKMGAGSADEPDVAELGGGSRPAPPPNSPYPPAPEPDVAAWRPGGDGINPDSMAYFRKRKP